MKVFRTIYIAILCLLAVSCRPHAGLNALRSELESITASKRATIGIALIINGKDTLTINGAEDYPMMSVYKFHQALAVCNYLQENGIPLAEKLYPDKKFFKPDTYSPLRDKYPQGDIELSFKDLMTYTLQLSDNIACDILFDFIGGTGYADKYIKSSGITDISICATEDEMHQDLETCYANHSTPLATAKLLELFITQDFTSDEYLDFVRHTMIECQTGKDRLAAPLTGTGAIIGHKTGTSDKNAKGEYIGINDVGFVSLPNGTRYVIAVFVKDSSEEMDVNSQIIADISAAVYKAVTTAL